MVQSRFECCEKSKLQMVAIEKVSYVGFQLGRVFHKAIHNARSNRKTLKGNKILNLTLKRDERILQK
jgi:hypothetical protein